MVMFIGVDVAVLCPFLVLSGLNHFYYERLTQMLGLGQLQTQTVMPAALPREIVEVR